MPAGSCLLIYLLLYCNAQKIDLTFSLSCSNENKELKTEALKMPERAGKLVTSVMSLTTTSRKGPNIQGLMTF